MDLYESTARVLLVTAGCLLVSQDRNEVFAVLPGGHIDGRETPEAALLREVREEIGQDLLAYTKLARLALRWRRGGRSDGPLVHEDLHLYNGMLGGALPEGVSRLGEPHLLFRWIPLPALVSQQVLPLEIIPYAILVGGVPLWR